MLRTGWGADTLNEAGRGGETGATRGAAHLSIFITFQVTWGCSIFIISHLAYLFQPNLFHVEPVQVVKHLRNNLNPFESIKICFR